MPDDRLPPDGFDLDALRDGIHNAEPLAPAGGGPLRPPEPGEGEPPNEKWLAKLERNDTGNAARLVARYGTDLVHVDGVGWHCWAETEQSGGRFAFELGATEAVRRAQWTQAAMYNEVKVLRDEGPPPPSPEEENEQIDEVKAMLRKERLKAWTQSIDAAQRHALQSGNAGRINAMLEMAIPDLARPMRAMDANPWLVTVENGTLELMPPEPTSDQVQDGCSDPPPWKPVKRASRRGDLITRMMGAAYRPDAACPKFEAFLKRILPSEAVRRYLQRLFGYKLTGLSDEHVFVIFWGTGRNGKSTLVDILRRVYGDYAATVQVNLFLDDGRVKADGPRPSLAKLPGVRVVFMSEPKKGARLDESLVKETTGGEPLETRKLQRDPFEFRPQFIPVMSTNFKPQILGLDPGIWGRLNLVPFTEFIPPEERDKRLAEKLWRDERDGILGWLLDGLAAYHEEGLNPPAEILAAVEEYRAESDPLGDFLDMETAAKAGARCASADLYKRYEDWCERNGQEPMKQNGFSRKLRERGFVSTKSGTMHWVGLELLPNNEPPSMGGGMG